jgi:hypothetical protein
MKPRYFCAAATALLLATAATAQTPAPAPSALDLDAVQATVGNWSYRPITGGSEADFVDSGGHLRLTVRCNRTTRAVSIVRTGMTAAAPYLTVTTTYGARNLAASFAAGNLTAAVAANDPLLDDIAFSRGKWAIANAGVGALVVPSWAEAPRVFEDCRS